MKKLRFCTMIFFWTLFISPIWLAAVGLCVILHECAHMLMCRALSVPVLGIKAFPWGVTAEASAIFEPGAQIAISAAGPMANFFLLIMHPVISSVVSVEAAELFALANLANGLLNLIPALPLDGGIILKSFLCARLGFVRGFKIMLKLSALIAVVIIFFGIYILKESSSNFSYIVAGSFMLWNLRHEKQLVLCLKKKILTGEIKTKPRNVKIKVSTHCPAVKMVDRISPSYTLIFCVDTSKELPQSKLLEAVLKNPSITMGECIETF